MDPVAHTLIGASLAETRLKQVGPLATATLIIGANACDIDAIAIFFGREASLGLRRGWTHGVLAVALLPVLVVGVIWLYDRSRRLVGQPRSDRIRIRPLLALAYLAVLTHPALDWLNTYGIRLLMPFDGRWFYGDALFIVDPWIWQLAATGTVLAHTRSVYSAGGWLTLAGATTFLVLTNASTPAAAKLVWSVGVAGIAGLRAWGGLQYRISRVAANCLAAILVYIGSMILGTHVARVQARRWLAAQRIPVTLIMAGPLPANPFVRDIVFVSTDRYRFLRVDWLADEHVQLSDRSLPVGTIDPVVRAALDAPHIQGTLHWMRFPAYEVEQLADGYRVLIRDVRFARGSTGGMGTVRVDLDRQLNVRRPEPTGAAR